VWQDNESIQQSVLDRDLILAGGTPPEQMQVAQQRWQELAAQGQKKTNPPPQPGSPEANYQKFITDVQTQVVGKTEQLLAQIIEQADLANAEAMAAGTVPPGGVVGSIPPKPLAPPQQLPTRPPVGKPMDARSAPVGAMSSVSHAPPPSVFSGAGTGT